MLGIMRQSLTVGVVSLLLVATAGRAEALDARAEAVVERALGYLKSQQSEDGSWKASRGALAISGLALKGFAQDEKLKSDPGVKRGFEYLLSNQLEDGGIYKDSLACYNTAICVSALAKANDPAYAPKLQKAIKYLRSLQWSDTIDGLPGGEKVEANDPRIGGWGYGKKGRPDGSNTALAVDALKDAGVSQDDPMFKRAAAFASHLQNNKATNDAPWATNDGGFIYSLKDGGESFAGYREDGGVKHPNSYGSMTYAGIKELIYAGVSKSDPRVVAGWQYVTSNWSLEVNPGMIGAGKEHEADGMFYYYHILARTLHEFGETAVPTPKGNIDWREALVSKLESLQKPDGSFVGGKAYMEDNAVLVTSYSVLSLQEVLADLKARPAR
jgi:squalene-hopene/tetraprenyl-beta-curcumene cyclase